MTERKVEKVVETREHSFENVLGIPSGSTEVVRTRITSETKPHEHYDEKDEEIEQDFLNVHDKAMELYEILLDELDDADQSKVSRLSEVAGQILNTALNASERRRVLKQHIDTIKQKDRVIDNKSKSSHQTNNILVATHEELSALLDRMETGNSDAEHTLAALDAIDHDSPPTE